MNKPKAYETQVDDYGYEEDLPRRSFYENARDAVYTFLGTCALIYGVVFLFTP